MRAETEMTKQMIPLNIGIILSFLVFDRFIRIEYEGHSQKSRLEKQPPLQGVNA
jgi:hypothetical protein